MALVIGRLSRAGCAEGLAGTASCPNRSVVGPSGKPQGERPSADAGEEMTLAVASKVIGPHVNDRSLVNIPLRNVSCGDKIAEPLCGIGIDLVVIRGHGTSPRLVIRSDFGSQSKIGFPAASKKATSDATPFDSCHDGMCATISTSQTRIMDSSKASHRA